MISYPENLKLIHNKKTKKKKNDDVDDVGILHCRQSKNVRVIHVTTGCLITYQLIRKLNLTQVVRTSLGLQRLKEAGEPISRSPNKEDNNKYMVHSSV